MRKDTYIDTRMHMYEVRSARRRKNFHESRGVVPPLKTNEGKVHGACTRQSIRALSYSRQGPALARVEGVSLPFAIDRQKSRRRAYSRRVAGNFYQTSIKRESWLGSSAGR